MLNRPRNPGYTLFEILMVVGLMAALATIAVSGSIGMSRRTQGSDVLAQLVADELRQARAAAKNAGVPTALVFPSAKGTVPHSQSCYLLSGEDKPRIERVSVFAGDFPQSCVFVGTLGAGGETTTPLPTRSKPAKFSPSGWYDSQDYQFIFLPSGAIVTNDLPMVNGNYVLVVAGGVRFGGTAPPNPPAVQVSPAPAYFQLGQAESPYTVTISPDGQVAVVPGVLGGAVADSPAAEGWLSQPAKAPSLAPRVASTPEIVGVDILPKPDPLQLPPGVDAVVRDKEYLSITVRAADDTGGGPLFCEIEATDELGAVVDGFASEGRLRMQWNSQSREWVHEGSWTPPPKKPPGSIFSLTCTVTNQGGGSVSLASSAAPKIEKTTGGKFYCGSYDRIYVLNDDGSNQRELYKTDSIYVLGTKPRFSADGKTIAFVDGPLDDYPINANVKLISSDGTWSESQAAIAGEPGEWDITQDGGSIVKEVADSLYLERLDGSSSSAILGTNIPAGNQVLLRISPTGRRLAYFNSVKLYVCDWDRAANSLSAPLFETDLRSGGNDTGFAFSPDGTQFAYGQPSGDWSQIELYVVDLDGARVPNLIVSGLPIGSASDSVCWSPEGDRIAFFTDGEIKVVASTGGPVRGIPLKASILPYNLAWRP